MAKKTAPKINVVKKPAKKDENHPLFDGYYEKEVTFICPVRGKVTQKVKIKKFKTPEDEETKEPTAPVKDDSDFNENAIDANATRGVEEIEYDYDSED